MHSSSCIRTITYLHACLLHAQLFMHPDVTYLHACLLHAQLFMHPDDHAGDREAVLFIAFLITVTNIQTTETGLGKVTTLLRPDLLNWS